MGEFLNFDGAVWQRVVSLMKYDPTSPLTLATGFFLFAFLVFALGYIIVKRRPNLRTWYVTLFSLYFYYKLSGAYILLLGAVTLSDYLIGKRVAHRRDEGLSTRGWVALSVAINVAILAYFKATGFFVDVLENIYRDGVLNFEGVVVPAGVSFFVFQSIAYVVDIARGTIKPLKRFIDYLFLLSFFPKMFLGPLVKAKEFIPQIEARDNSVTREDFGRAVTLIAGGLLKYAVIASSLGALFVNPAFKGELGDSGVVALLAIYGFTMQIYCDFSGYTDIAIGCARIMGIRLMKNFNHPYVATSIKEFWSRWHISLSTWFKDYLYIPLGGNRCAKWRHLMNLFIVFLVSGLWHGAAWTFVIWGALHGVYQIFGTLTWKSRNKLLSKVKLSERSFLVVGFRRLVTFALVCFAWIFFRANSISDAFTLLSTLFSAQGWSVGFTDVIFGLELDFASIAMTVLSILTLIGIDRLLTYEDEGDGSNVLVRHGAFIYYVWIVFFMWAVLLSKDMTSTFIYFQF